MMTYDIKYAEGTNNMKTAITSFKNVLNFMNIEMTAIHHMAYIPKQVTSH
jgi:hypothetical protein